MEASCWVARKIFLSPAIASSRARTLDSRPTTNGVIMNGNMTTSRMGIIGNRFVSDFSFEVSMYLRDFGCQMSDFGCVGPISEIRHLKILLAGLFEQRQADLLGQHHFLRDLKLAHLLIGRDVVHQVQHQVLE